MDKGSEIFDLENITALYADDIGNNYGHNMLINGTVRDCTTKGSLMRSWYGLITIGPDGLITNHLWRPDVLQQRLSAYHERQHDHQE